MKGFQSIVTVLIFIPVFVHSQVVITEVMYDVPGTDTDREWIEIQNTGTTAVDISTYKFFENNQNHTLSIIQGNPLVASNGFAIIADKPEKFLIDNPGFLGTIFDSSFSLSNTGEELSIKDSQGNVLDTVTYDPALGAGGDGNTSQKTSSGWKAAMPTPGGQAVESASNNQNNSNSNNQNTQSPVVSTHYEAMEISTPAPQSDTEKEEYFSVSAGRNRLTTAGSPIEFTADLKTNSGMVSGIEYKWALGDGFLAYGKTIEHIYAFPGDYVVVLSVSNRGNNAVHRINVKVSDPKLSVRHVDGGIEIKNEGKEEINIFKWEVVVGNVPYDVPADQIILPSKSVVLDSRITKFPIAGEITLTNAMGKIVRANMPIANNVNSPKISTNISKSADVQKGPNKNVAATGEVLVIEHQGFVQKFGAFFKRLFSKQ